MKQFFAYLMVCVLLTACKSEVRTENETVVLADSNEIVTALKKIPAAVIDTILLKDRDTVLVLKQPAIKDDIGDKRKDYPIQIYFAHKGWPRLTYKNAIGADLYFLGDLDGDQSPEILLRPEWFSSCWASINLYSLKAQQWKLIKTGSMYFCSDLYPLSKRVIKTEKGYALLTDSLAADKFITLKKEIKF